MIYKTGIDLSNELLEFISKSEKLFIFVPYVKLESINLLLESTNDCKLIVVRWHPRDILQGSSDLDVYEYCKDKNIKLFRNRRIHLKAYIDNYSRIFMGSPNISSRALNLPEMDNYNYEMATIIEKISIDDRLYFNKILNESLLITDSIFDQIKTQIQQKERDFPNEAEFDLNLDFPEKDFLISSLPLTYNIKTLFRICDTKNAMNDVELNCAMHDLALYGLPLGLNEMDFMRALKDKFFSHPFIKAFLENLSINNEIYFGSAKEWIHKNCADVPIPRKWEITENIQILYRWIVDLGDGKYKIDVPGTHSERLFINQ